MAAWWGLPPAMPSRYTFRTMPEFPDANSGGLDPLGAPTPKCKAPLGKRVRAWTIIVALYGVFLGMAAGAVPLLRTAFRPGVALDDRLMHLVWAGCLLLPLGLVVRYFVRVRLKTGRWRGTPEQRKQDREQRLARCTTSGGKRVCAARQSSPNAYAIKWASCSAFDPTCTPWQRTGAWLVLVLYTLAVLTVAVFGLMCFGAGFADDNTLNQSLLWIGLGMASLIWPVVVAVKLVRGIRDGQVGTTREELDELRAQRIEWRMRESQKPLRSRLVGTAATVAVYALWWMRAASHHAHESWVTPAMAAPWVIYAIWVQFRRPKSAPPANGEGGGP